jgi:IMP dehydrogenase
MKASANNGNDGFYLNADQFFKANLPVGLTYDDLSLATLYSEIPPQANQSGHAHCPQPRTANTHHFL